MLTLRSSQTVPIPRVKRTKLGAFILGGEFPDFPEGSGVDGDPSAENADPLAGEGVAGAVGTAGDAAVADIPKVTPGSGAPIPDAVAETIRTAAPEAIDLAVKGIPTVDGGVMGQSIQANITKEIRANPAEFHDSALSRALEAPGVNGDIANVEPSDVTKAYQDEMTQRVTNSTNQLKDYYGDTVKDAIGNITGGDTDFDTERPYKDGKSVVDSAIDDPEGTQEKLQADADDIEKKNPDWKDKVKAAAAYGAKGLLILALIGAFLPGGRNIVDKLGQMAGTVIGKLVTAAANILKAFFGPLLKSFWDFVKKLKGPLIVIGIIIAILLVLWVYRQIRGSG